MIEAAAERGLGSAEAGLLSGVPRIEDPKRLRHHLAEAAAVRDELHGHPLLAVRPEAVLAPLDAGLRRGAGPGLRLLRPLVEDVDDDAAVGLVGGVAVLLARLA